ncbi:MAG: hypothetical protein WBD31_19140 [Rubripirellula sp.]
MNTLIEGRYWILKSWLFVVAMAGLFSCSPAVFFYLPSSLPPAYQLKSVSPLADTAPLTIPDDPGERSHGAKLTPRLTGSILLFASTKLGFHPYIPATLGGLIYLLCGITVAYRLTGDRVTAIAMGALLAGLYASNACFSMNFAPKPFDGVALGMIALTIMTMNRPWLMGVAAFLAIWSDERAIVSLGLIGLLILASNQFAWAKSLRRISVLVVAMIVYAISRSIVSASMNWASADTSMLGENLVGSLTLAQMAAWSCFEGGWIVVLLAVWVGYRSGNWMQAGLISAAAVASIASCLIVLDITRASAFAFPLVFVALACLSNDNTETEKPSKDSVNAHRFGTIRQATVLGAAISIIAANFEIIAWTAVVPLPSTLMSLFSLLVTV